MSKLHRNFVELIYANDGALRAEDIPYDGTYSVKQVLDTAVDPPTHISVYLGGDLKTTVEGITDSSINKPYVVSVGAGVYAESESITIPAYVTVEGLGVVIIDATGNAGSCFIMTANSFIDGISVSNVSTGYAFSKTDAGNCVLTDVSCVNCKNGVLINHSNAGMTIREIQLLPFSSVMTTGIDHKAGNITVDSVTVGGAMALTNIILSDGATSVVTLRNLLSLISPSVVNGMVFSGGARASVTGANIVAATLGISASTGANVSVEGAIYNCGNGLKVTGTGTTFVARSLILQNSTTLDIEVEDASIIRGTAYTNSSKASLSVEADLIMSVIDDFDGDKAVKTLGEHHVGTPGRPSEFCSGEGDSYVNGMAVYTYDGSTYTDVTTAAKSVSGSPFTFPNLAINTALYFTSQLLVPGGADTVRHHGLKLLLETAQVGGTIVLEYYNGATWVEFNGMATDGNSPYFPYAKDYFGRTGGTQVRYDIEMVNDSWAKNDDPGLGTSFYWVRARITATLTTAPVLQQAKMHSSRMEINADGWPEYFGNARFLGKLPISVGALSAFEGSMAADTVWFDQYVGAYYPDGKFTSSGDKTGTILDLPVNTDTSCKLTVRFSVHPVVSGTYTYNIRITRVEPGATTYESAPASPSADLQTEAVSIGATEGVQAILEASFDISEYLARRSGGNADKVGVSIESTTGLDSILTDLVIEDIKWSDGGHSLIT